MSEKVRRQKGISEEADNGKTFQAAERYLKAVVKDKSVQTYLSGLRITWQFNAELAPWWGGAFE